MTIPFAIDNQQHRLADVLNDLLDRILYRLAGLTDDEAVGLERRLARML